ncbi:ABC transporter permease [Taklimakanibacter deserti]|uniref:ABC transporter permease n=1 Tax=Taklimakanibacter deserti TaxID=2267839 RepID=UPI000E648284
MRWPKSLPGNILRGLAWAGVLFLIAPLLVVIPVSFTPERYLSLPSDALSLRHYETLIFDRRWSGGILTSLLIASVTTLLSVVIGTLCAVGMWRIGGRSMQLLRLMILAPLIVPSIVHALAFYRTWIDLGWLDTVWGVIVAHTTICVPLVMITVSAALSGFDYRLEYAARSLGARPFTVLWRIILPNIVPGVVSGGVFAFITSWDEIITVLFITARKVRTLPQTIWSSIMERVDPAVAAVSTVMIALTLAAVIIRLTLAKRAPSQS